MKKIFLALLLGLFLVSGNNDKQADLIAYNQCPPSPPSGWNGMI